MHYDRLHSHHQWPVCFFFSFFFRKKERKEKLKCEKIRKKREIIEKKGPLKARRGSKADGSKREREM